MYFFSIVHIGVVKLNTGRYLHAVSLVKVRGDCSFCRRCDCWQSLFKLSLFISLFTIFIEQVEDTEGVIRRRNSKKYIQCNGQKFEDTTGVTKSRISKEETQYNGQKKKDTRTNNDLIDLAQRKSLTRHSLLKCLVEVRKVGGHVYVCSGDRLYLCFYGFLKVQSNLTMRSPLLSSHLY